MTHFLISIDFALLCWMAWRVIASRQVSSFEAMCASVLGLSLAFCGHYVIGALEAGAILFSIGYFLWWRGYMGGGDVRLLGAAGLTIPLNVTFSLAVMISLSGGLLSLFYLLATKTVRPPVLTRPRPTCRLLRVLRAERWRIHRGCPLPYVCAIAAGVIFVLR